MIFKSGARIVFFGDSITAAGRDREDPASLGDGYVSLVAAQKSESHQDAKIFNRGIGGNGIGDLQERLDGDVLAVQPTCVSILVGINDTGRRFDKGLPSPPEEFQKSYRLILQRITAETQAKIVICEPFLLPVREDRRRWRKDLDGRIRVTRELAWEFGLPLLPLDGIFAAAATSHGLAYWLRDGVHPTPDGHALIAEHWLALAKSL